MTEKEGLDFTCWWQTKSQWTWTPPKSTLSPLFLSFQSQVRRREGQDRGVLGCGAQEGEELLLGCLCSHPARAVPPQGLPGSPPGHQGWGRPCSHCSPGIPEELLWLALTFWWNTLMDIYFLLLWVLPLSQESNYWNSIKNTTCFENSFPQFLHVEEVDTED